MPGELCNSLSGCEERGARCHGGGGMDRGVCVLARLHPSDCGARRDLGRLGMQMVALGLLGQSWCCGCRELRTKCFSGVSGSCAGSRWDGEAVCKSLSVISALITAYTTAFCVLVCGAANCIGSQHRVHLGRKGWKSWRCDVSKALEQRERLCGASS